MPGRELELAAYRLLVRFTMVASLALVVFGLYQFLQGSIGYGLMGLGLGILALVPSQYYRIRATPGAENLLLLLGKPDCSLCDEARVVLRRLVEGTPFTIEEVNIRDYGHLKRRFKNLVPVVLWQGDELARLRIEPTALKARLDAILAERGPASARAPEEPGISAGGR